MFPKGWTPEQIATHVDLYDYDPATEYPTEPGPFYAGADHIGPHGTIGEDGNWRPG